MANYGSGAGKPMGELMESIPGTEQHRATHGVTGGHAGVQGMMSNIPGTEQHRMREAGVVGGGSAMPGMGHTGTHTGQGGTMGERIKEAIPGTREYEATHGMTQGHRGTEQLKSHIPGTEEHHIRTGMEPGHGMGTTGTGAGMGTTGMGHHGTGMGTTGAGLGATGAGHHGAGMGTTGAGYDEHGKETMGHKIKKMIPGTEENKEKKLEQGRI